MKHFIVIVAVVAATSTHAFAQPAEQPAAPTDTVTVKDWYGYQILGADAAVFAIAAGTHEGDLYFGWVGTGAAVHAAHGHGGRAVASVVMRAGLPVAGLLLGASSAKGCSGDLCELGPALIGGMLGMGIAEVTDVAMAWDEEQVAVPKAARSWTPVASVRHDRGATFGIAARF